jgi:glyoxylase-like metal-dependent hydrolase (beta-lactamase superfamily II)
MSNLKIKIIVLGMVQTNCYIASNEETKEAIVIDPADHAHRIEQYLKENDLVCKGILLTHGHFDHIMAASELAVSAHTEIYAHEAEAALLADPNMNASSQIRRECALIAGTQLKDNEIIYLAGFKIRVIHSPGHTAGSVCYYFSEHGILFSGDTLFQESVGRTDLPTGNGKILIESIRNKLMLLEDQVKVYPGHGAATTIGYERDNNIYINQSPDFFDF